MVAACCSLVALLTTVLYETAPAPRGRAATPSRAGWQDTGEAVLEAAAKQAQVAPELFYRESHSNLRKKLLAAAADADGNGDGKLSLKEVSAHVSRDEQRARARFKKWDRDRSGTLVAGEVRAVLAMGNTSEAAIGRWEDELRQMDLDRNGQVSSDEFVGSACKPCIMMALDLNRDGFIGISDELLKNEGHSLTFGSVLHWLVGEFELKDLRLRFKRQF